ncbi:hypothetical protein K491DRAFT_710767 [Lophiostoma macrostomum CBS 122681]|uniref:Uncharacterized protein n=1 Tax=Lophiostoma macrostomum CBS 122681 TaxID=1314788 RepID=A0A6A6TNB0_9PLEO|nr:hypothetical protein K491DRAFT_710767 [Lophiostoma macrostomum CBS 122681]
MPSPPTKDPPHKWPSIAALLPTTHLASDLILSRAYLDAFTTLRDTIPLTPGTTLSFPPQPQTQTQTQTNPHLWIDKTALRIYTHMDSLAYCVYDDASAVQRGAWKPAEVFVGAVYAAARRLAVPGACLGAAFERKGKEKEKAKESTLQALKALIMITHNLMAIYIQPTATLGSMSSTTASIVARIEERRPTPDPARSPIPRVRVEWRLRGVAVEDLRERVLRPRGAGAGAGAGEKGGKGGEGGASVEVKEEEREMEMEREKEKQKEKEWLIELIAGNEELVRRTLGGGDAGGDGGGGGREKRKREVVEEDDEDEVIYVSDGKKVRTG